MVLQQLAIALLGIGFASSGFAQFRPGPSPEPINAYDEVVYKVEDMWKNEDADKLAKDFGLDVLSVTWEDTGRFKNSSVGPNISDMTIQVQVKDEEGEIKRVGTMPVIRYPNFSDKTADLSPNDFQLLVGNEKGGDLEAVTLTDYLFNFRDYLNNPDSWKGKKKSLLSYRDDRVLVSAQVAFLPIPQGEGVKATFNPALFNYQSYEGDPAVLAIVATREGTSATIIDNERNRLDLGTVWGQRLFFNEDGFRASFTGTRASEFEGDAITPANETDSGVTANGLSGANAVLLIQVPLKQKKPRRGFGGPVFAESAVMPLSSVEDAVIGHGELEGTFTEIDDLEIERDERFPIRVTVQFYKATDRAELTKNDLVGFNKLIRSVYDNAEAVGSLVTEGETDRATEHDGPKYVRWPWWGPGPTWPVVLEPAEAVRLLESKYGAAWPKVVNGDKEQFVQAVRYAQGEEEPGSSSN